MSSLFGPSHVLMDYSNDSSSKTNTMQPAEPSSSLLVLSMDDYISKRQKAHASCPSFSSSCWEGVVRVEMELVECCERLHENDDDENDDEVATKGGVLAIEKGT